MPIQWIGVDYVVNTQWIEREKWVRIGEVWEFNEQFEEIVEDRTPRDMYKRLRGSEGVGSESCATPCGRDNDFH